MVSIARIMITISTSINHPSSRISHHPTPGPPHVRHVPYGNPPLKSTAIITNLCQSNEAQGQQDGRNREEQPGHRVFSANRGE